MPRATEPSRGGPGQPAHRTGSGGRIGSGTRSAAQSDTAGPTLPVGRGVGGTHGLGARPCVPGDLGRAEKRRCRGLPARTRALRRPAGGTGGRDAAGRAAATSSPDLSLWDPERISAWRRASNESAPPPLAVMRIPKIGLEVPVSPGTDDFTLNRAVGHIDGTALPGTDGNSGIAGHRDGFFRGLKDSGPVATSSSRRCKGRSCTASNGPGSSLRRTYQCSTHRLRARSRWSRAIRSTTSVQRRNATSSAPCVPTPPRPLSEASEQVVLCLRVTKHRAKAAGRSHRLGQRVRSS